MGRPAESAKPRRTRSGRVRQPQVLPDLFKHSSLHHPARPASLSQAKQRQPADSSLVARRGGRGRSVGQPAACPFRPTGTPIPPSITPGSLTSRTHLTNICLDGLPFRFWLAWSCRDWWVVAFERGRRRSGVDRRTVCRCRLVDCGLGWRLLLLLLSAKRLVRPFRGHVCTRAEQPDVRLAGRAKVDVEAVSAKGGPRPEATARALRR